MSRLMIVEVPSYTCEFKGIREVCELVRCEECMHNGSYDTDCPFGWRNGEWNIPKPCDFCSYGERNK